MIYYTFTTLATVGFGDYYPCADEEKILACCVFLSGVSVVSYLMGIFSEILKKFQKLNVDLDEGDILIHSGKQRHQVIQNISPNNGERVNLVLWLKFKY